MSAAEALNEARAAGIHFNIDGDDLVLEAPAPPPPALLSLLKHHKADILAILKPAGGHFSKSVPPLANTRACLAASAPRPTPSKLVLPLG
jgi:hypothetical protein